MPGDGGERAWRAKEGNWDGQKRHVTVAATRAARAPGSVFDILLEAGGGGGQLGSGGVGDLVVIRYLRSFNLAIVRIGYVGGITLGDCASCNTAAISRVIYNRERALSRAPRESFRDGPRPFLDALRRLALYLVS